jgi:hypothetical protein
MIVPLSSRLHNESHKGRRALVESKHLARRPRVGIKVFSEKRSAPRETPKQLSRSQYHLDRRFSKSPF